ncbi:hypothetical protein [Ferruginibacter profundus]
MIEGFTIKNKKTNTAVQAAANKSAANGTTITDNRSSIIPAVENSNGMVTRNSRSQNLSLHHNSIVPVAQLTKRKKRRNSDGAWTPRNAGKGTGRAGAGNQDMNTVNSLSWQNVLGTAYSVADNLSLGALGDTVDLGSQMLATNKDDTWKEAASRRAKAAGRWGLRMAGRAAVAYMGGAPATAGAILPWMAGKGLPWMLGATAARHAYPAVTDRIAAGVATNEPEDQQSVVEKLTRRYYSVVHGEEINTSGWQDVGASKGGSRNNNYVMDKTSASDQAGGIRHNTNRLMSRQWTHLVGDSLGGESERDNLTAASHGANIAMTPGEESLAEARRSKQNAQVKTTAFERTGLPVARGLNFQGSVDGKSRFNQNIDAARWPVTKAEQARLRRATSGNSWLPSVVGELIPRLSDWWGKK